MEWSIRLAAPGVLNLQGCDGFDRKAVRRQHCDLSRRFRSLLGGRLRLRRIVDRDSSPESAADFVCRKTGEHSCDPERGAPSGTDAAATPVDEQPDVR